MLKVSWNRHLHDTTGYPLLKVARRDLFDWDVEYANRPGAEESEFLSALEIIARIYCIPKDAHLRLSIALDIRTARDSETTAPAIFDTGSFPDGSRRLLDLALAACGPRRIAVPDARYIKYTALRLGADLAALDPAWTRIYEDADLSGARSLRFCRVFHWKPRSLSGGPVVLKRMLARGGIAPCEIDRAFDRAGVGAS